MDVLNWEIWEKFRGRFGGRLGGRFGKIVGRFCWMITYKSIVIILMIPCFEKQLV